MKTGELGLCDGLMTNMVQPGMGLTEGRVSTKTGQIKYDPHIIYQQIPLPSRPEPHLSEALLMADHQGVFVGFSGLILIGMCVFYLFIYL